MPIISFTEEDVGEVLKSPGQSGAGVGLSWDQAGTELREAVILFDEGSGERIDFGKASPIPSALLFWMPFRPIQIAADGEIDAGDRAVMLKAYRGVF